MSIELNNAGKSFLVSGRSRRPLYRELLNLKSAHSGGNIKKALQGINLSVADGARVALIGSNGAGKSTLLRLIAGIYQPNSGQVRVNGRVCCFLEPGAGAAAALPVIDNVYLYAALAGLGHAETRDSIPRILEFCGLSDQEFTWVEHLSFGMQQRLFMSILLEVMRIGRAEIFLFDEFLVGVDQAFRYQVIDALTRYPSGDQIVLHASHDHELMIRTCPQAIYLEKGVIRHFGATQEVVEMFRREETRQPQSS